MKITLFLFLTLFSTSLFSQDTLYQKLENERELANNFQYDAILLFSGSIVTPTLYYMNGDLQNPKYSTTSRMIVGLSFSTHLSGLIFLGKSIQHRKRCSFLKNEIEKKFYIR